MNGEEKALEGKTGRVLSGRAQKGGSDGACSDNDAVPGNGREKVNFTKFVQAYILMRKCAGKIANSFLFSLL